MANFVLLLDTDRARRERFLAATRGQPAFLPGLEEGEAACGDLCAVWAHGTRTPFDQVVDGDGLALLWGDAIPGPGPQRLRAADLRDRWRPALMTASADTPARAEAFDGYHAAVVYDPRRGLLVGADILGCFPLYAFTFPGGALVGTSPSLFAAHPSFRLRLSPDGLVRYLLFTHIPFGRALADGVARVEAGRVLHVGPAGAAHELRQYDLPVSRAYFDHSYRAQLRVLDDALEDAHARHIAPGEAHAYLLSGGMDTRMTSGYLRKLGRPPNVAVTFGAPGDGDLLAARLLAKRLGWHHRVTDVPRDAYERFGAYCARVEHLAGGFAFSSWGYTDALRDAPARVITGYGSDVVLRGCNPAWDRDERLGPIDFDYEFAYQARGIVPAENLAAALRPGRFRDAVPAVVTELRRVYEDAAPLASQRSWIFSHRALSRMMLGMNLWRLSFFAWPVQPVADRRVLAAAGGMPQATLGERRAQQDLIVTRFPDLAALPVARSWYDLSPLAPSLRWRLGNSIEGKLARAFPRLRTRHARAELFYHRLADFNGERYRAARAGAEAWREAAGAVLVPEALDRYLPRPDVPLAVTTNRIGASTVARGLVGFLHWLGEHPNVEVDT